MDTNKFNDFRELVKDVHDLAVNLDVEFMSMQAADDSLKGFTFNFYGAKETLAMMVCTILDENFSAEEVMELMKAVIEVKEDQAELTKIVQETKKELADND